MMMKKLGGLERHDNNNTKSILGMYLLLFACHFSIIILVADVVEWSCAYAFAQSRNKMQALPMLSISSLLVMRRRDCLVWYYYSLAWWWCRGNWENITSARAIAKKKCRKQCKDSSFPIFASWSLVSQTSETLILCIHYKRELWMKGRLTMC